MRVATIMTIHIHREFDPSLNNAVRAFLDRVATPDAPDTPDNPPTATLEHDPRWLHVLKLGLGHKPTLLTSADAAGRITGVLPLARVRSPLFGSFLVSLPYLNRAGVLAPNANDRHDLIAAADDLALDLGVDHLELRHDGHAPEHDAFTEVRHQKVVMLLDLPQLDGARKLDGTSEIRNQKSEIADAVMQAIPSKVRNLVRKGDKAELSIAFHKAGDAALPRALHAFYDAFAITMRDVGTPVFPRRLFAAMLDAFPHEAELVTVTQGEQTIAGAILLHDPYRQVTQVPSACALRAFNHTSCNMWMYFHLLRRSVQRGSRRFDFGRTTPGSGPHRFKKQWGAVERATPWCIAAMKPAANASAARPDNPAYQRRIEAWQKLPVWVTKIVGPPIVRGIP
ncbi:MAG: FemAB family XrtA/PEP-CTERM system-associated protein [Planctomycetota bacterium]